MLSRICGLDHAGMAVGGFLPMKWKRDDGRGKELAAEHGLQECPVKGFRCGARGGHHGDNSCAHICTAILP